MDHVTAIFAEHLEDMITIMRDQAIKERIPPYDTLPPERLRQLMTSAVTALQDDLSRDVPQSFPAFWEAIARPRAEQGFAITSLLRVLELGADVIDATMMELLAEDAAALIWWSRRFRPIIYKGVIALSQAFITAHEHIIREQASQIRALATPIMPMYHGVLVLPLVGRVDSSRASQVMEELLTGIVNAQAEVVLIDVTGVPLIDTDVANAMLQIARAAQLLGAQVVLVGISAEIAQTLVQFGVELGRLATRSNLQSGIEYALRLQGQAIQPLLLQKG